ncbi:hypothetical protein [Synechococcus elongatus]|uniref:hypothetical protein n=1 Tax=Synechococcus elongatus TaxID=32046 RepID=UPI0030CE432F
MKKLMCLLISIVLFLALVQAPTFALTLEDEIKAAKIANQYVDILCEAADLQVSEENAERYINDALRRRSINFTQEDLGADNEFSKTVAQKVGARIFTSCPLKLLTWMAAQKATAS